MECNEWVDQILREFLLLVHHVEENNFDYLRFDRHLERTFLHDYHLKHLKFFFGNQDALFATRKGLADEDSRKLFDRLILYRMLGQMHVRLPTNTPEYWEKRQQVEELPVDLADETGIFGKLCYFNLDFLGQPIHVKAWRTNIVRTFVLQQYFYHRGNVDITPGIGDQVIDAGACFGDNALAFAAAVGQTGRVYSFDMMSSHLRIISQNMGLNPELASRVSMLGYGLSDISNQLSEALADEATVETKIAPGAQLGNADFPVRSIDELLDEGRIGRVDFIKMDIEGSELAALRGGERTLRRFKPKLAISLYHKPEDFCLIPEYLDQLGLGYQFHLGHYTIYAGETVLYARARGWGDSR